ncbi:hypothetical protein [Caldicellulosiruptor sp. DIB 104C]|uniref:hypothetical protein n=1 Tax=Caldicellulosiruptor sp. DIB 104C TaxID=3019889 RepID=UPI0023068158|nr:hypothetical protein [Caldicellulosiruptor sp. DIB 104C]
MKKFLTIALIISLVLTIVVFVKPVDTQAGSNAGYITAGEFVTQLLTQAKVTPATWDKAVEMKLIPPEVKKDKPLTRAQASYIVWKLINAVPELKDKNIPVKVEILSPVDYTLWPKGEPGKNFRGAYVPWYRNPYYGDKPIYTNAYRVIRTYNIVVIDKYYKDGTVKTVHVWNRLRDYDPAKDWVKLLQRFMKEQPNKVKFDFPQERTKALVWDIMPIIFFNLDPNKQLPAGKKPYTLYRVVPGDVLYPEYGRKYPGAYYFYYPYITHEGKTGYAIASFAFLQFGKYKTKNPEDWNLTAELNPIFNESLNRWLMILPRQYPLDYTRFKYICVDFKSVPKLYQEAMLRLADLGIITPDVNIDKNIFKTKFVDGRLYFDGKVKQPKLPVPDIRFNAGRILTQKEATEMIARVFDESRRKVVDEMTFDYSKEKNPRMVDESGWTLYDGYGNPDMAVERLMFQHTGTSITLRVDELWQLFYAQYLMEKYPDAPMLFTNAYYLNPDRYISNDKLKKLDPKMREEIIGRMWYKVHLGFGYIRDGNIGGLGPFARYQPVTYSIPLVDGLAFPKDVEEILAKKVDEIGYYTQNTKR